MQIDQESNTDTRNLIETTVRELRGVVSVHIPIEKNHLVMIKYNPDVTTSTYMLTTLSKIAGHSEMIGLYY